MVSRQVRWYGSTLAVAGVLIFAGQKIQPPEGAGAAPVMPAASAAEEQTPLAAAQRVVRAMLDGNARFEGQVAPEVRLTGHEHGWPCFRVLGSVTDTRSNETSDYNVRLYQMTDDAIEARRRWVDPPHPGTEPGADNGSWVVLYCSVGGVQQNGAMRRLW